MATLYLLNAACKSKVCMSLTCAIQHRVLRSLEMVEEGRKKKAERRKFWVRVQLPPSFAMLTEAMMTENLHKSLTLLVLCDLKVVNAALHTSDVNVS